MPGSAPSERPSYDPQALLNAQPVIVAVIDPETYTVQFQNETGLKKFGDISGRTCHEAIAGCAMPCAFCKMPEAVRTGQITTNEVALPQDRYVLVQWSTAMTDDGRLHVIEAITDITERKQQEAALHRTEKMEALSRLAGGMAHDFNNLLTVINGYSEQVLGDLQGAEPQRDRIRQVQRAVDRAAALTRNLVAFSHHQVLQPMTLDMNAVIHELEPALRGLIGERIELSTAFHVESQHVVADRQQIERVIANLVSNACEAMPHGGKVSIATTLTAVDEVSAREHAVRPGLYVRVAVQDMGRGIPPDIQPHIFEPFFTEKTSERSGLGLATVYGIVRQTGGFVTLFSESGAGALFAVHVPCCERVPAPHIANQPSEPPKGNETILLVEDDEDVRIVVGDMLRAHGYTVREASDGLEALEALHADPDPLHLILTDVLMPRMTGPQLVERLATLIPTAKVLYMSAYAGDILEPATGRPLAFIQKPFTAQVLVRKVRETLATERPTDPSP